MEGTLNVTTEQLRSTASDFQSRGQTVSTLTSEMMTLVTGLNSAWEGDAATAYINQFKQLEDDIQKMVNMINEHVNDLNEMADNYDQAENANVEEASGLSADVII